MLPQRDPPAHRIRALEMAREKGSPSELDFLLKKMEFNPQRHEFPTFATTITTHDSKIFCWSFLHNSYFGRSFFVAFFGTSEPRNPPQVVILRGLGTTDLDPYEGQVTCGSRKDGMPRAGKLQHSKDLLRQQYFARNSFCRGAVNQIHKDCNSEVDVFPTIPHCKAVPSASLQTKSFQQKTLCHFRRARCAWIDQFI